MKENGFLRHGACLALMAMLPTMFGPSLMMQPVEAQTKGGASNPVVSDEYVQFFADEFELWLNMWGNQQYSSDLSILTMTDNPTLSGLWNIDAHQLDAMDNDTIIGSGFFQVTAWYELVSASDTQIDGASGAVISGTSTTYAVSGVLTGSTGFSQILAAAVFEGNISNLVDPDYSSNSFVLFPLQSTPDIAEATQIATDLFNAMTPVPVLIGNAEINPNGGGTAFQTSQGSGQSDGTVCGIAIPLCLPEAMTCECLCAGIFYTKRNTCAAALAALLVACTRRYLAFIMACTAACTLLAPELLPACSMACMLRGAGRSAACFALAYLAFWACLEAACGDFIDCLMSRCGWSGQP